MPSHHRWRPSGKGAADEEPAARHEPRARARDPQRRGNGPAHRTVERRERALADVAAGEQRQQEDERRREEQEPRLEAAHPEAHEPQRGEDDDARRRASRVMRPAADRSGAFTSSCTSSKSETRSVTSSFQSPPGLSVTASAT